MKRLILMTALLCLACGTEQTSNGNAPLPVVDGNQMVGTVSTALELRPHIQPEGLSSLYSRIEVTDLTFYGALHLVPIALDNANAASTAFKFELTEGEAETTATGRPLRVDRPGQYAVLMTIHPMGGGHSVDLSGSVLDDDSRQTVVDSKSCRGEAAPTTADEGVMEAAPTTANEEDTMEAAPITANEGEMEAAPTTALRKPVGCRRESSEL